MNYSVADNYSNFAMDCFCSHYKAELEATGIDLGNHRAILEILEKLAHFKIPLNPPFSKGERREKMRIFRIGQNTQNSPYMESFIKAYIRNSLQQA